VASSPAARVRPLREADREAWRRLWERYLSFYRATLDDRVTEQTFARLRDRSGAFAGLVAVDEDDLPIGFAHLVFHGSTWSQSPSGYCYLEDLYVDPAGRGGRAGNGLFEAAYALARERGATRVYWHTQEFNAPARSLYDTVGRLTSFVVYEHPLE
jgi:GNAT superfamily N-acetyltransferase